MNNSRLSRGQEHKSNSQESVEIVDQDKPQTIKELLNEMTNRHKAVREKKIIQEARLMKGRSQYEIPDKKYLKKINDQYINDDHEKAISRLAGKEQSRQGIVTLYSMHDKQKQKNVALKHKDSLQDYVTHFSQIADLLEQTSNDQSGKAHAQI